MPHSVIRLLLCESFRFRAIGEEAEDGAQAGLEVERGALLLVAVCSQTGYLLALPVKSKNQGEMTFTAQRVEDKPYGSYQLST